jgi:mono/diheme cytochrome c family protein
MKRPRKLLLLLVLVLSGCSRDRDLPAAYRDLRVPTERLASAQARSRGRALYVRSCALCHGVQADGKGIRREGFSSAPRDFTDPDVRRRSSPRRMFFEIREGVRGTAMPSWKSLADEEVWDLVAYLRSVAPAGR